MRPIKQLSPIPFLVNNLLLFAALVTVISGLVLQLGYHIGSARPYHHGIEAQNRGFDQMPDVWGMNYSAWSLLHKVTIVVLSVLMVYHISKHWKLYKNLVVKNLYDKNKLMVALSVVFVFTAMTGILPWLIDLYTGKDNFRFALVEIHDKLALLLVVLLVLHVFKRRQWFNSTWQKINHVN